jgi:DNA-binding response OmpR family regulator
VLRVLILEDYAPLYRVLAVTLQRAGWEVALVHSACEALQILEQQAYDTLLVDMDMANGESWRALRALDLAHHSMPIVALLSPGNAERQELEALGVDAILCKPVGKEALLRGIRMTLRNTGRKSYHSFFPTAYTPDGPSFSQNEKK